MMGIMPIAMPTCLAFLIVNRVSPPRLHHQWPVHLSQERKIVVELSSGNGRMQIREDVVAAGGNAGANDIGNPHAEMDHVALVSGLTIRSMLDC